MADEFDVVVIGAGMAGLVAARALSEGGLRVCVLEARDVVGGRIMTRRVGSEVVELGAEFVHGRPEEMWRLIDEMGLDVYERGGAQVGYEDGRLQDFSSELEDVFEPLEALEQWTGPDCSFAEFLDGEGIEGERRWQMVGYVEGFNAADHRVISAVSLGVQQKAEDAIGGDRVFRVRDGYDRLPEYLAGRVKELGGVVRLGCVVEGIRWSEDGAEVVTAQGSFAARRVVVTLPLGVLQRGSVKFAPPVDGVMEPAAMMRMGQVCRFTLVFRRQFWEKLEPQPAMGRLSFLFTFEEMPRVWWTPHPERSNSITGWAGGPGAAELLELSEAELADAAVKTLAKVMGMEEAAVRRELVECYAHDWQADEFARGAYSYVAVGGLWAPTVMARPVAGTLFFAGEHTDMTGHWGTVHAAMRSGLRAAKQILAMRVRGS